MPINEQTHAKNLDNLRTAISIGQSIGGIYKPSKTLIEIASLQTYEAAISVVMQGVNNVLPAEENAVGARMAAFKLVPKRVTKILNAAKGQGLTTEFISDIRTTANAIRGVRVSAKTPDDPLTAIDESKKSVSSSNRSFAGQLESIDLFVEQLKSNPDYSPTEAEYQTPTLDAWLGDLNTLNQTAIDAKGPTRTARNERNAVMYNNKDGLIVRAQMMKQYVRSILDTSDTRFIQLNRLKFVDLG